MTQMFPPCLWKRCVIVWVLLIQVLRFINSKCVGECSWQQCLWEVRKAGLGREEAELQCFRNKGLGSSYWEFCSWNNTWELFQMGAQMSVLNKNQSQDAQRKDFYLHYAGKEIQSVKVSAESYIISKWNSWDLVLLPLSSRPTVTARWKRME